MELNKLRIAREEKEAAVTAVPGKKGKQSKGAEKNGYKEKRNIKENKTHDPKNVVRKTNKGKGEPLNLTQNPLQGKADRLFFHFTILIRQ